MSKALFQGILQGIAEAHGKKQTSLFEMENKRRETLANYIKEEASNPNRLPESQDELKQLYLEGVTAPKLDKSFESRVMQALVKVKPRTPDAQQTQPPPNAPIPSAFPSMPIAPPVPPEGFTRNAMYSPQEQMDLRGQGIESEAYHRAVGTARGTPATTSDDEVFPFGTGGLYQRKTGKVIREPEAPKPPVKTSLQRDTAKLKSTGKPIDVLIGVDPDDTATFGRSFKMTSKGPVDITDDVEHYERPATGSHPNSLLNQMRALELANRTNAAEGQLIYTATGLPVNTSQVGNAAAERLSGFNVAREQVGVVGGLLDSIGSTGAIKGYALKHGVYWPIAQDNITPEQAEAVSEVQRLVNDYLYASSGKSINETEMGRIQQTAPNLSFTAEANKRILAHFDRHLRSQKDSYLKLRGWKEKPAAVESTNPSAPPIPDPGGGFKVGETVNYKGKPHKVVGVTNGKLELEPVK